jgi:hypothetical protein
MCSGSSGRSPPVAARAPPPGQAKRFRNVIDCDHVPSIRTNGTPLQFCGFIFSVPDRLAVWHWPSPVFVTSVKPTPSPVFDQLRTILGAPAFGPDGVQDSADASSLTAVESVSCVGQHTKPSFQTRVFGEEVTPVRSEHPVE